MATTLKVRCKPLCRPNAAVCNATKKLFSKRLVRALAILCILGHIQIWC